MKSILSILLALSILFALGSTSLAAVHSNIDDLMYRDDVTGVSIQKKLQINNLYCDTWYSVEPIKPKLVLDYYSSEGGSNLFNADYNQNDHYFVNFTSESTDGQNSFSGSYLVEPGLFVGLNYFSDSNNSLTILSPGYRLYLSDLSYLAFSFNYMSGNDISAITAYDIDYKYNNDNMKIFAQYYIPTSDNMLYNSNSYDFGVNYKYSDAITLGVTAAGVEDDNNVFVGVTWKPSFMTVDGRIGDSQVLPYMSSKECTISLKA